MATSPNAPVAINKVSDEPPGTEGDLVAPNDGGPGYDKVETKQVVAPDVAATARTLLHSVVTSGTGGNAYTGDSSEWGKTGTTENNGDAWFVGANRDVTIAVWVGHADSVKPMETEYGGGPVDGGTIPALIFNEIVGAYEQLSSEQGGGKPRRSPGAALPAPTATAPAAPSAPAVPAPQESSPASPQRSQSEPQPEPQQQPSPAPSNGGGSSGGAPATGGISG
jgi:penicillin-binding protein 1A